jgi:hypothetical protein
VGKESHPDPAINNKAGLAHNFRVTTGVTNVDHRQLLPLVITLLVLGLIAWVCYQVYLSLGKIQAQARKQMGDHVVFTKDGMRVNVQNMENESYLDKTQSWFVKAWELGSASSANDHEDAGKRKRFVSILVLVLASLTAGQECLDKTEAGRGSP